MELDLPLVSRLEAVDAQHPDTVALATGAPGADGIEISRAGTGSGVATGTIHTRSAAVRKARHRLGATSGRLGLAPVCCD
ncbi:MAG: hypothetical protein ACYCPM_03035 [Acidobacteriaceae bacterium]